MSFENHEYKGHLININVDEVKSGRWSWSYTIDGQHYHQMEDRPLGSQAIVAAEALDHAKRLIDRM